MKSYILTLMAVLSSVICFGQKFEVTKLQLNVSDLSAVTYPRNDLNSNSCALMKVQIPFKDISFEGNVIGDVVFKSGEYWVYLSEGSKSIVVKHDDCTPTIVNFSDYGVDNFKGKQTYVLNLNPPKSLMYDVVFKVSPSNAILAIDNIEYDLNGGMITVPLTANNHTYMVVAPGYYSQSNSFQVNKQGINKIVIELDPKEPSTIENIAQQPSTSHIPYNTSLSKKIGIYDEERFLNSIPDVVAAQKKIQEASAKYESEYNKLTADIQKKYNEFQKEQATLPQAIKDKRTNEIMDYGKEIDEFKQLAEQDIAKMRQELIQPWLDKCETALSIVRNSMGLVMTQNITAAKLNGVDYIDITNDLTNIVLGKSTLPNKPSIGVYDSDRAFKQLPKVVAAQKELSELYATYEKEFNALSDNFNKVYGEYQKMQNDSNMPQSIKDKKIQEIADCQKKTEDYGKQATESLQNRQNELFKPIEDKFKAAISLISSRRGLVSTQDATAARLGGVEYIDITEEIVSMLR